MSYTLRCFTVLSFVAAVSGGAQSETCPSGNDDVRIAALSALAQLEADQVLPSLKKILERRDPCSATLRRQVIGIVSRSRYGDQTDLLLNVARSDPNMELRRYAVQVLSQTNADRGAVALDSIVFSSAELDLRNVALGALSQQTSANARATVRRAAEMTSLPSEVRMRAINALGSGRRLADETEFLTSLYGKMVIPELRDATLRAIANQRTSAATTWLLGIVRDRGRDIDVRRQALSAVSQALRSNETSSATGIDLNGIVGLYDDFAGQVEMQDRVLDVIAQRPESAATDKLLQVARSETNLELRRKAVIRVGQRRDPRVREFLLEVLNK